MKQEQMLYIEDTIVHKSYVLEESIKLFRWLCSQEKYDLAKQLIITCCVHDNSKLTTNEYDEMPMVSSIAGNKHMTDPTIIPNDEVSKILELHWENNSHHPEHYKNINHMNEIDILEMVCDWSARSRQYNTNLLSFAKTRLENRFVNFSQENKQKILNYCEILTNIKE